MPNVPLIQIPQSLGDTNYNIFQLIDQKLISIGLPYLEFILEAVRVIFCYDDDLFIFCLAVIINNC